MSTTRARRRTTLPQFLLTTVDESLSGSVEVVLGGVSIGYLNPVGDGSGNYEIDLDEGLADAAMARP